jgi:hypothetical protein
MSDIAAGIVGVLCVTCACHAIYTSQYGWAVLFGVAGITYLLFYLASWSN